MSGMSKFLKQQEYISYLKDKELEKDLNKKKVKRLKRNKKSVTKLRDNQIKLDNPNERKFRYLLIEWGVYNVWQSPFYCEERYVCVDFYLPETNTVIEIDGASHDVALEYDIKRTKYLKDIHGVKEVLRITNKQIANDRDSVEDFVSKLI